MIRNFCVLTSDNSVDAVKDKKAKKIRVERLIKENDITRMRSAEGASKADENENHYDDYFS